MSDVLQTAVSYRKRLKAELARVEEFLRMAEEFSKGEAAEGGLRFAGTKAEEASPVDRLRPQRPAASA